MWRRPSPRRRPRRGVPRRGARTFSSCAFVSFGGVTWGVVSADYTRVRGEREASGLLFSGCLVLLRPGGDRGLARNEPPHKAGGPRGGDVENEEQHAAGAEDRGHRR